MEVEFWQACKGLKPLVVNKVNKFYDKRVKLQKLLIPTNRL